MVREPVSQTHLDFSVQVVERVRKECITAADLRALFIQFASRGAGSQVPWATLHLAFCTS